MILIAAPESSRPQIRINCLVLGGDLNDVFQVDIVPTETVYALKELIKGKKHEFDIIPASNLRPWKVDLPLNDGLEDSLKSLELDPKESLFPLAKISKVFFNIPNKNRLHIVVMPPTIRFNCLVLDGGLNDIFHIDILQTETANVYALKELIKKKRHEFDIIPASALRPWKVNLPLNDGLEDSLKSLELNPKESLFPLAKISKIFFNIPNKNRLHIVVMPPAIRINCLVLGGGLNDIFHIYFLPTETVYALKESIKKRRHEFDIIDASHLRLWKVDLPLNDGLEDALKGFYLDPKESLLPLTRISFFNIPNKNHLHIVISLPPTAIPSLDERQKYIDQYTGAPSTDAMPAAFSAIQLRQEKQFLCSRPRSAADPVPVTLLEPIFAEFVDNCQKRQPTADDNRFALELSERMCLFYESETSRMSVFMEVLCDIGIDLEHFAAGRVPFTTDGHLMSSCNRFVLVMAQGKNEIGSGGAEPFAESLLYYRKFMDNWEKETTKLQTLFPCIHIIVFGACIGIAGSVFPRRVQSDILIPIIPLFWHSTDLPMRAMVAHALGALRIAVEKLKILYDKPIPRLEPGGRLTVGCPYPRQYTDSTGRSQDFSYDKTQPLVNQLIFFGETNHDASRKKLCIKFVRCYSPEAHRFCAQKGHAPELIAFMPLPGGWNMVVMDSLEIDSPERPGLYRSLSQVTVRDRQPLEEAMTSLILELHNHNGGYVHGDIRDTNFFVRDDMTNFILLDFDWAGPIGQNYYPISVNWWDIRRPDGARDGMLIKAEHDLEMLGYIFRESQLPCVTGTRCVMFNLLRHND